MSNGYLLFIQTMKKENGWTLQQSRDEWKKTDKAVWNEKVAKAKGETTATAVATVTSGPPELPPWTEELVKSKFEKDLFKRPKELGGIKTFIIHFEGVGGSKEDEDEDETGGPITLSYMMIMEDGKVVQKRYDFKTHYDEAYETGELDADCRLQYYIVQLTGWTRYMKDLDYIFLTMDYYNGISSNCYGFGNLDRFKGLYLRTSGYFIAIPDYEGTFIYSEKQGKYLPKKDYHDE